MLPDVFECRPVNPSIALNLIHLAILYLYRHAYTYIERIAKSNEQQQQKGGHYIKEIKEKGCISGHGKIRAPT